MDSIADSGEINAILGEQRLVRGSMGTIVGKYASDDDRGLGIPTTLARFDPDSEQFIATNSVPSKVHVLVVTESRELARREEQRFLQALRDYERNARPIYKTGLDVDVTHTMAQVWSMLDSAVARYEQREENPGVWGRVRLAFRGLGEHGQALDKWLGLLPTQSHYLSVVCGGVKLILGAAERLKDVREAALNGIHDIPILLNGVQRVLGVHTSSERLEALSDSLYTATLTSLGHILQYIRERAVSKTIKAIFKQSSYQKSLTESLKDIERRRDAFNEEARLCGIEMEKRIEDMVHTTNSNAENIQSQILLIQQFLHVAHMEYLRTQHIVDQGMTTLDHKVDNIQAVLNHVADMMMKYSARDLQQIVLSRLDYNVKCIETDVNENYSYGATMPPAKQDRSVYILTSPDFVSWIRASASRILIINGRHMGPSSFRSPLSFISARLVSTLNILRQTAHSKDQVAAVHFFCGEHADRGDKLNSAAAIMNHLLAQLLASFTDLDPTTLIKLGDFRSTDLDAVCKRFKALLALLTPNTVIFCIIDNLPFYLADERTSKDTRSLLRILISVTRHQKRAQESRGGCRFKLLLTTDVEFMEPEISALGDDEVLNIPVTVPQTGGFTEMKWVAGVETVVNEIP
ncbi:hypothetical protein BJX99DRAFT_266539 [Aspergillus californicus]